MFASCRSDKNKMDDFVDLLATVSSDIVSPVLSSVLEMLRCLPNGFSEYFKDRCVYEGRVFIGACLICEFRNQSF